MKDLSLQQGVDNTDVNFVNGKLVDLQTLVGEGINQDIVQFFQNIADLAGIVFNGLPDNDANGYQTVEALETFIRSLAATTNLKGTVEKATTAEAQNGTPEKYIDAALLQLVTAEEDRKGVVERGTQAEVNAGEATRYVTGATLAGRLNGFLLAGFQVIRLDIPAWNMDTASSVNVPYTLPAGKRIVNTAAKVFRNTDSVAQQSSLYRPLGAYDTVLDDGRINGSVLWHSLTTSNAFTVQRTTGGEYDNGSYDGTSGNRGFLYVWLEDIP